LLSLWDSRLLPAPIDLVPRFIAVNRISQFTSARIKDCLIFTR
jgi:hypothetical protein